MSFINAARHADLQQGYRFTQLGPARPAQHCHLSRCVAWPASGRLIYWLPAKPNSATQAKGQLHQTKPESELSWLQCHCQIIDSEVSPSMTQLSLLRGMTYPQVNFNGIAEVFKTSLRDNMARVFVFAEKACLQIQHTAQQKSETIHYDSVTIPKTMNF